MRKPLFHGFAGRVNPCRVNPVGTHYPIAQRLPAPLHRDKDALNRHHTPLTKHRRYRRGKRASSASRHDRSTQFSAAGKPGSILTQQSLSCCTQSTTVLQTAGFSIHTKTREAGIPNCKSRYCPGNPCPQSCHLREGLI